MKQIAAQKGAFVPDLAQRPGDRHIINTLKSKVHGGKRTKEEMIHILFADREDLYDDLKAILAEESTRQAEVVVVDMGLIEISTGAEPRCVIAICVLIDYRN